ncbi:M20 metallopeptidase family protein [Fundicoccus sp. Sow4_F4]|uniref:M20 metallopeptidase family protein n=1 Tax=Fundicoccus sp. Sow4_F4 TaxID=3438783 RepID=UPI003F8FB23A
MNQMIKDYIEAHQAEMIAMRQHLHQHPELAFEEFETTKFIAKTLDDLGLDYRLMEPTGVMTEIRGDHPGKTVLLRADMDALPIQELNHHLNYASQNAGKMHACGHDGHVSMLMMALKALLANREQIKGKVRFIFQPAEEIGQGAKEMIKQGVLEGVDNAFGIHIWTVDEAGLVNCIPGACFAATDRFQIHFQGSGGHAAQPHLTNDAVVMVSQYIAHIQTIISRATDPLEAAVLTVGKVDAGDRFNIIAENAKIEGTVRTFDPATRNIVESEMKRYAERTAAIYGGTVKFDYQRVLDPVINERRSAQLVQSIARAAFGEQSVGHLPPTMGGEDFGEYTNYVPGAFATVGTRNESKGSDFAHHHARFNIDEDTLIVGAELYAQYALAYLKQEDF